MTVRAGRTRIHILKGTLDVLVLRALSESPMHAGEVGEWIENACQQRIEFDKSAIYQALYRLSAHGMVATTIDFTFRNRKARYYSISAPGRARLRDERRDWKEYAAMLSEVLS